MVVDTLDHLEQYAALNPLFEEMIRFIRENDLNVLESGKHLIKGDDLFVNIQDAAGRSLDEAVFETHRRMLDVQIPLSAEETFGYRPLADLPDAEYNEAKDITKYPGAKAATFVNCKPGEFVMFWPQDGHQPCIGTGTIHKAIFKVKV